jgi:Tol biopolymer transport system component
VRARERPRQRTLSPRPLLGAPRANPEQKAHSIRPACSYIPLNMAGRHRLIAVVVRLAVAGMASSGAGAAAPVAVGATGDLPVWSHDGNQIAFVAPTRLGFQVQVMSERGAGRRVVAAFARTGLAAELRWAGNRRLIVSTSPDGQLQTINLSTGSTLDLGGSPGGLGSGIGPLSLGADDSFAISRDGSRVAYVADSPYIDKNTTSQGLRPEMFAIGVVRSSGGRWHLLPQPINASDTSPSFSPNGRQVVFARSLLTNGLASAPSLMTQSVNGGQARPLNITGTQPVWSPNGRWIAYQRVAYGPHGLLPVQLQIVSSSSSGVRTLWKPSPNTTIAFSWSPDSSRVAFITQSGALGTVTLSGTVTMFKLPMSLLGKGYPANPPQWSPDGKTLVFAAAPSSDRKEIHVFAIGANGRGLHALGGTR